MRKLPGAKDAKDLIPSVLLNARNDAGIETIVVNSPTELNQAARGSFNPATLAIAPANVRMACDRCEAIAQRIESGEALRYDLELAEAMEQITLRARRVIDAGAVTPTVCRHVCRR